MAIELKEIDGAKTPEVTLTGKLVKVDYETFVPAVDQAIAAHGKLRMLVVMHGFHGWTASAAWEDTKFGARHFRDIERLAMVAKRNGSTAWRFSASRSRLRPCVISSMVKSRTRVPG